MEVQGYVLRVEVKNAGKSEARRVRVQLLGWASERTNEKKLDWIAYDIDPLPLKWVEAPGDGFFVDLAAGMSGLVYVAQYGAKSGDLELCMPDDHRREFQTKPNYSRVTYWVEVAVAAENADVATSGFYFSTARDKSKVGGIHSVRVGDPPPADRVLKGGYLSLFARMYDEAKPPWWRRLFRWLTRRGPA